MQSSAFWTLKFSKCLDSILNIRHTFTKEKKSRTKAGAGAPWAHPKSTLGQHSRAPLAASIGQFMSLLYPTQPMMI